MIFMDDDDRNRFIKLLYLANGDERRIVMSSLPNKSFVEIVKKFSLSAQAGKQEPLIAIGAYCLMPNHFHILARGIKQGGISLFMQKLMTAYAMYFNARYKRTGRLFEGKFKSSRIDNDNYLRHIFSYIHLNPIKLIDYTWKEEGLQDVEHARDFLSRYQYSSYFDYAGKNRPENILLNRGVFPEYFQTPREFSDTIEDWLNHPTN